jgi:hypothetical protein
MTDDMRNGVKTIVGGVLLGLLAGVVGCGGGGSSEATERLWVSTIPTKHTEPIAAFVTARSGDHYVGTFYRGSLLRGSHDAFKWTDKGKGRARIELLQDGQKLDLTLKPCEPIKPFDQCIVVESDRTGPEKYYSRKRWVVRRPGKRSVVASGLFDATLLELAEDDEELAAALDAADEGLVEQLGDE